MRVTGRKITLSGIVLPVRAQNVRGSQALLMAGIGLGHDRGALDALGVVGREAEVQGACLAPGQGLHRDIQTPVRGRKDPVVERAVWEDHLDLQVRRWAVEKTGAGICSEMLMSLHVIDLCNNSYLKVAL